MTIRTDTRTTTDANIFQPAPPPTFDPEAGFSQPSPATADAPDEPMSAFYTRTGYDPGALLRAELLSAPTATPAGAVTPETLAPVPGSENASREFKQRVIDIAADLGTDPNFLMAIMSFESGLRADAVNPQSGATGLIQFLPSTARGLGTTVGQLAGMSPEQQLDYVARYFAPYVGRLNSLEDAYMAVLYPAAIGRGSEGTLFSQGSVEYAQNRGLDLNRDGRVTVGEATELVRQRLGANYTPSVPSSPPSTPTTPPSGDAPADGNNNGGGTSDYTVRPGDTLSQIAARHGTTWQEIARLNNIPDPDLIHPGQVFKIPTAGSDNGGTTEYVVRPGDTLSQIAARHGTTWQEIARLNNIPNPDLIYPGQVFRIPTGGGQSPSAPAPTAPAPTTPAPTPSNPTPGVVGDGRLPATPEEALPFFKMQYYHPRFNPTGPNASANCGPASLAMTLAAVGLEPPGLDTETSIDRARALMNPGNPNITTVDGVPVLNTDGAYSNFDQIAEGIRQAGGTPEYGRGWEALDQALAEGKPVVLNGYLGPAWRAQFPERVGSGDVGHLNSVLGKTADGRYIVADPMHEGGPVAMTREQLAVFFQGTDGGVPNFVAVGGGRPQIAPPAENPAPVDGTTPTSVGGPDMTADDVRTLVARFERSGNFDSPLNDGRMPEFIVAESQRTGVPVWLMMAQVQRETTYGNPVNGTTRDGMTFTNGRVGNAHNLFNIRPGSSWQGEVLDLGPGSGPFRVYGSYQESVSDYARLLSGDFYRGKTIAEIVYDYFPPSDNGGAAHTERYIQNLIDFAASQGITVTRDTVPVQ